jgi:hypothetical protein
LCRRWFYVDADCEIRHDKSGEANRGPALTVEHDLWLGEPVTGCIALVGIQVPR